MFILPHSSSIASGTRPYVTWSIIILCLLIQLYTPASRELTYYPQSWNPLTMITASLTHADWLHIGFNLIFFYAFSPMLEMVIARRLRYVLILLSFSVITHISYSIYSLIAGTNIPTLGLSGVVMGVMGMTAYIMPRAGVRTAVWFVAYVRNHYIPAWVLVLFFLGGDIIDLYEHGMNGTVNLISHVSGGIGGYLIGLFFFRGYKAKIQNDLNDELEYDRSQREDIGLASTYRGNRRKMIEAIEEKQRKRDHADYVSQIYTKVNAGHDSEAIMLILEGYVNRNHETGFCEDIYERMQAWKPDRARLCLARLCIDRYMNARQYTRAIEIAMESFEITPEFVLADPVHVLILARFASETKQYPIALQLLDKAETRYGEYLNLLQCQLLEIELLWYYLDRPEQAKARLKELLARKLSEESRRELLRLAQAIQSTSVN